MNQLASIVAVARGGVIGANGALPWRIREDMRLFKRLTLGHAVIMGRATYDSIGKPLVERRNIVISRTAFAIEGCEVARDVESAIALARETDPCPFVIGGATIYAATIDLVTDLYLTEIDRAVEGDTFFDFDRGAFTEVSRTPATEEAGVTFLHLARARQPA